MNVLYRTHTVPTISHTYDTSKQIRDRDGVYVVGRVTFWFDSNRKRVRATTKHDSTIKINYAIDIHMCNVSISAAEQPNIRIISIIKWAFLFSFRSSERMWRQTKKSVWEIFLLLITYFFLWIFSAKKVFFCCFSCCFSSRSQFVICLGMAFAGCVWPFYPASICQSANNVSVWLFYAVWLLLANCLFALCVARAATSRVCFRVSLCTRPRQIKFGSKIICIYAIRGEPTNRLCGQRER